MRSILTFYRRTLVLAFLLVLPSASYAEDFKINRLFVIGDALSDGGTASQSIWSLGYPSHILYRVTENNPDGSSKVWAEFVGNRLSIDVKPNIIRGLSVTLRGDTLDTPLEDINVGGTNYAELGGRANGVSPFANPAAGLTATSAVNQIDKLLSDVNGKFHKNDVVTVWAGADDAFFEYFYLLGGGDPAVSVARTEGAATALAGKIQGLRDAGAKNIIVLTIPVGSTEDTITGNLFRVFNEQIKAEMSGKDGIIIDPTRLIDATRINPERFGFVSIAEGALSQTHCQGDGIACLVGLNTNPGGPYTRSDANHPSQQQQSNFADLVYASLQAASQNATMTTSTLSTLRQAGISIESRLLPGALEKRGMNGLLIRRAIGDIKTYASLEGGYFEDNAGQIDPGSTTKTASLKAGGDVMVTKNALVGMSISLNKSNLEFDQDSGGFENRTIVGSLYTNIALSNSIYVNAMVGAGYIELDDITRKFNIGPSREVYNGETDGSYKTARIGIGYKHLTGGWSLVPAAAYTYESLKINGYTESYGVASLSYGDNELESSRVTASLTATYNPKDPNGWTPMFRVSLEHEFKDDDLKVNFGPDEDNIGSFYLPRPDGTYGYLTAGVSKKIGESSSFGVNATTVIGGDGVTGVSGGISFKSKF